MSDHASAPDLPGTPVVDCPARHPANTRYLVEAAAAGDAEAWNALVDHHAGTVWAVARGCQLSAADAGEVSRSTWLRLVENLDRLEHPDQVGTWLAVTARAEALRMARLHGGR